MPNPGLQEAEMRRRLQVYIECGRNQAAAAKKLGIARSTLQGTIETAAAYGIVPAEIVGPRRDVAEAGAMSREAGAFEFLKRRSGSLSEIAEKIGCTQGQALDALHALKTKGINAHEISGTWAIEKTVPNLPRDAFTYKSNAQGKYKFGFVSDTHLASKYARLDCLSDIYDMFEKESVDCVFHGGNWIDGEASFNRHDLLVHGMDQQLAYLAKHYPQRRGLITYSVAGDDHEGWYSQREGVDIGRYAEMKMRDAGRTDWVHLGYMEAFIPLVHSVSGAQSKFLLVHPGGGSAYATSYAPQKFIECVPLHSEILTKSGWRKHNEVLVGDDVLGYNVEEDRCEWTKLLAINMGTGPLVRYWNDQFDVQCTENHKWAIEWESRAGPNKNSRIPQQYSRRDRLITTIDKSKERSRIIQVAVAPDGPGMPKLLHQEWLRRAIAPATVLTMTSGERRAFIEGMLLGEGCIGDTRGYRTVMFSQNAGPVLDAFRLACFLEGIATTCRRRPGGTFKPSVTHHRAATMLNKRMRICNRLKRENIGTAAVWCPTTALGTWAMRQGDLITITGNSLEGGEKPAVIGFGHWHKMEAMNIRNVWSLQMGCFQDQTPFARKKRLEFAIGGGICELTQREDGSIIEFAVKFRRYFNRGQTDGRWSHSGDVKHAVRTAS